MPVYPIREVGSGGVIKEAPAASLDAPAWSEGRNVIFTGQAAVTAPTFVRLLSVNPAPVIRSLAPMRFESEAYDVIYMFGNNGECGIMASTGAYADCTPKTQPSPTENNTEQFTWCSLANVLYVNRSDLGIRYVTAAGQDLAVLPNTGDTPWTCKILRSYKDFLIALNVKRGGVEYSNLVKWSDAALNGQVPSNWDYELKTNLESLSGENPIAEMYGPIVDGLALGDFFIVYGRNETWSMTYTGSGEDVFTFRRLFGEGARGPNCAVDVHGVHYVFGEKMLFCHDGTTLEPIQVTTNGRNVYQRIDVTRQHMAFASHDVDRSLVLFCYPTKGSEACNEAFAYNYTTKTGSYIDLPNVYGAAVGSPSVNTLWTDMKAITWASYTLSWSTTAASYPPNVMFCGSGKAGGTLWLYQNANDPANGGADMDNSFPMVLERSVMNLDAAQAPAINAPIRVTKRITSIQPLMGEQDGPMTIEVCSGMTTPSSGVWKSVGTFDGSTDYKVGTRLSTGRWIGFRFTVPAGSYAELVGYDIEWLPWGGR